MVQNQNSAAGYVTWAEAKESLNEKLDKEFASYCNVEKSLLDDGKRDLVSVSRNISKADSVVRVFRFNAGEDRFSKESLLELSSVDNVLNKLLVWFTPREGRDFTEGVFESADIVRDKYVSKKIPAEVLAWEKAKNRLLKSIDDLCAEYSISLAESDDRCGDLFTMRQICLLRLLSSWLCEEAAREDFPQELMDDLLDGGEAAYIMASRMDDWLDFHKKELVLSSVSEPEYPDDDCFDDWD